MFSDFRYALRALRKTPGFTLAVILSLALGIGANTTVLSWIQGILLNPLPGVDKPGELVVLKSNNGGGNISAYDSRDFAQLKDTFVDVEISQLGAVLLKSDEQRDWVYGQVTSANFFEVLGVKPLLGRTFLKDEDRNWGGNPVLVIGEELWRKRFHSDPQILGRQVDINRHTFTIIGVVPAEFVGTMTGLRLQLWAPLSMSGVFFNYGKDYIDWRGSRPWHNLARLKAGVSIEQAQAAIDASNGQLAKAFPRSNEKTTHQVLPLSQSPTGAQSIFAPALKLMLCVSLMVLLIVSANVANLLLARAVKRQKEIAIRLATGASRRQLIRLFLVESLTLASLGGLAGVLLSFWMSDLIVLFLPSSDLPVGLRNFSLEPFTLLATCVLTLLTGLAVGLAPALQASRGSLAEALKDGGRSASGTGHRRLRNTLVVSEVTVSIVLLVCSVLCIKGFRKAGALHPGFDTQGVLIARLDVGMQGYDKARGTEFFSRLQKEMAAYPGVKYAALASWFPLGFDGCKGTDASTPGRVVPEREDLTYERSIASPGLFSTLGIPLLNGRDFSEADSAETEPVVVVNEALAQRFWPGKGALGQTLRSHGRNHRVIGVVKTVKMYRMDETPRCQVYFSFRQWNPELELSLCIKVEGDPRSYAEAMRKTVAGLDPEIDVRRTLTFADHAMAALFISKVTAGMLAMLGSVALLLAAMGLYAVMAYSVNQRIPEFGIRIALGASTGSLIRLVLSQALLLTLLGIGIGIPIACLAGNGLSSFLYGVSPFDPVALLGVPLLLLLVALLACSLPALRASRVDPVESLKVG